MVRPRPVAILHLLKSLNNSSIVTPPSFLRHVLDTFQKHTLNAVQAAAQLDLSVSRFYALATDYNTARAPQSQPLWTPAASGGGHAATGPLAVTNPLIRRLACSPPCPHSFAASEALRRHAFKLDRAQVHRWAFANQLAAAGRGHGAGNGLIGQWHGRLAQCLYRRPGSGVHSMRLSCAHSEPGGDQQGQQFCGQWPVRKSMFL